MALRTCPRCASHVFEQTPACPRCGQPLAGVSAWPPPPRPRSSSGGTIATVVVLLVVGGFFALSIVAVLAIYGVRKYIANAKMAEAKSTLAQIAHGAAVAYEGETLDGRAPRRVCPSARAPVPADRTLVSGRKYMSSRGEWAADAATRAGFACLRFEMTAPQYYQYEYSASATGFVARAHGDLNGDGVFSTFEITGQVVGDRLVISPAITEISPDE